MPFQHHRATIHILWWLLSESLDSGYFRHPEMQDPNIVALLSSPNPTLIKTLAVVPFYHVYGMIVMQCGSLLGGFTIVVLPRFEPKLFLESVQNYQVSAIFALCHV